MKKLSALCARVAGFLSIKPVKQAYEASFGFDVPAADWNGRKSMHVIATLHDKNGEIILTEEGFQVIELSSEYRGKAVWTLSETMTTCVCVRLTVPYTNDVLEIQNNNFMACSPGDVISINITLHPEYFPPN